MILDYMPKNWRNKILDVELEDRVQKISRALSKRAYFPQGKEIFNCLHLTPFENVRVVILGQDPYPDPGQAHGLAFSVRGGVKGKKCPPSLKNIADEVCRPKEVPDISGDLTEWARQGVLLLNTTLTIEKYNGVNAVKGKVNSHKNIGWEYLTGLILNVLASQRDNLVFIGWGAHAAEVLESLEKRYPHKHKFLKSSHPSPRSFKKTANPFFGCGHFEKANEYLREGAEIDWRRGLFVEEARVDKNNQS